ncbi:free fatty acid receptor 2-like [Engraulis encrasicolus]|uniref:free fatty acid receptor 2-like n=1 Tax=Engraulis encrasicolus TaxID=184585 RepID=UPI002FD64876
MSVSQILLCVYIVTFILGFPANILAFCTFCVKVRRKPAPMDILLLNLTICDLIFLIFLPFKMKEAADGMEWYMDYILCPVASFFFFSCIYTSTFILTAVAVDRYLAVAFPIKYNVWRRPRYAIIVSVCFWLVSAANLSITYIVPLMQLSDNDTATGSSVAPPESSKPRKCYDNFENGQLTIITSVRLELFLVLFLAPFLICCFCYINFIRILSQLPSISRQRRLRAVGLGVVTLLVFTVCFGPYNISHVVGYFHHRSEDWRHLALISTTLNACLDPFIFYFSSAVVRKAISCTLRGVRDKLHLLRCCIAGRVASCCCCRYPRRPPVVVPPTGLAVEKQVEIAIEMELDEVDVSKEIKPEVDLETKPDEHEEAKPDVLKDTRPEIDIEIEETCPGMDTKTESDMNIEVKNTKSDMRKEIKLDIIKETKADIDMETSPDMRNETEPDVLKETRLDVDKETSPGLAMKNKSHMDNETADIDLEARPDVLKETKSEMHKGCSSPTSHLERL